MTALPFEFTNKKAAVAKLEELFLSRPSKIYNPYRVKATGLFVLREEARSNG